VVWLRGPGAPMQPEVVELVEQIDAQRRRRRTASDPADGRRNNKFTKNNITMQWDAEEAEEQGIVAGADEGDYSEGGDAAPSRDWSERQAALNSAWLGRRHSDVIALRFYETMVASSDLEASKCHIAVLTMERYRLACSEVCSCGQKQPPR
jgi:hypothetical protein